MIYEGITSIVHSGIIKLRLEFYIKSGNGPSI